MKIKEYYFKNLNIKNNVFINNRRWKIKKFVRCVVKNLKIIIL